MMAGVRNWVWSAAPAAPRSRRPWELALSRALPRSLLLAYVPVALILTLWGAAQSAHLTQLVEGAHDTSAPHLAAAKQGLLRSMLYALPPSLLLFANELRRERFCLPRRSFAWTLLPLALSALPLLFSRLIEQRSPVLAGLVVLGLGVGAAASASYLPRLRVGARLQQRLAWGAVGLGVAVFVAWIGFMAHWRFITFHASPYDMSWETNALHNIVHSGVPKTSVGAGNYYAGEPLPAPYAALHTPWIYYLFAPAYALFQDGRTMLWSQTLLMALGAVGLFAFARKWLRSDLLGVAMALAYLCFPHVQLYCLHDVHANQLAIPVALLALGAMEQGYKRLALLLVLLTSICREETGVYGIAIGLFWACGKHDVRRVRFGLAAGLLSMLVLLLITKVVMPLSGGQPRYSHFGFFFDSASITSLLKSFLFNPWGAISILLTSPRPEYVWLSVLPLALLPLVGGRGAAFLLIPAGLLLPAGARSFFVPGINYGAPIVLPMLVMATFGARWLVARLYRGARDLPKARLMTAALLLTCSVAASVLFGNLFAKTYKLEFGAVPYRQSNEYDLGGEVGALARLPPFGQRERLLWEVIDRVPKDVPISTSWRINPQLANREVSLLYPVTGSNHPPANHARYVVIDRLPSLIEHPEKWEHQVRSSGAYEVFYENASGVIFRRKDPAPR